jgi:hypothetical protein
MFLRLLSGALCALWLAASFAQAPAADAAKRGFMWEARKGERRVLLLGTIHVGKAPAQSDAALLALVARAEVIAVEADVSEAARVAPIVQRLAYYAKDEPGLDARAPALKARLAEFARKDGLSAEPFWRMKPWMVANTLVVIEATRLGFSPAYATEAFLFDYARKSGKPIVEIESIEDQLRLFDTAPESTQIAYLKQALDAIDNGSSQDEITRLVRAWDTRDGAEIERLLAKMRDEKGAAERFVVDKIIDGRHPRMVDAIERYAASGRLHVVAVGTLHYFGRNGLLELLKRRGYTIDPVS